MQLLVFILAYPLIWIISILPYRIFYWFSDFVHFVVVTVFKYRKKVVYNNLKLVFPEKTESEIKRIQKEFYKHMIDMFLEMIKTMNLSKKEVKKRYDVQNIDIIKNITKEKSVLIVCSHFANWEWNVSINNYINAETKGYAIYQRVSNKYFNDFIKNMRARWNTELILQQHTMKAIIQNERDNIKGVYGMVSDQSPQISRAKCWEEFMGIKVPIFNGAEVLAKKLDIAVVFLKVSKVKRGYYKAEFYPITTDAKHTEKNEITKSFLKHAETQIREKPEHYLWTHRRWKHRDKVPKEFL